MDFSSEIANGIRELPLGTPNSIGYGRTEIEPGIAPLVQAVTNAGYRTFSSCEGHPNQDPDLHRFPAVSFYANEQEALRVKLALGRIDNALSCSWILHAAFVAHRDTNEWVLGWTLENCGIKIAADADEEFEIKTVEVGRERDVPLLTAMFDSLRLANV